MIMPNIALIEILEEDVEKLGIPFTLHGIYNKKFSPKIQSKYLLINDLRKQLADAYRELREFEEYAQEEREAHS